MRYSNQHFAPGRPPLGGAALPETRNRLELASRIGCGVLTALGVALTVGACSDVLAPAGCGGSSFAVNVSLTPQRTRPVYSWNEGRAFEIRVSRASDAIFAVWRIAANNPDAGIASPVQHGSVPAGATVVDDDESTLSTGVRYCLTVRLLDGEEGTTEFRP
ncbi:MAG: hypothetical protein ACREM1_02230 [Longimicrobiales bacterium]